MIEDTRTRVLAYLTALIAVFALAVALGRAVGPLERTGDSRPTQIHTPATTQDTSH